MVGVFIRKSNGNFKRISYAKKSVDAKVIKKQLELDNPDEQYVISKLNWK